VLGNANAIASDSSSTVATQYCGLRNWVSSMEIRNLSTYKQSVRVTTWVCRRDIPTDSSGGAAGSGYPTPNTAEDWLAMIGAGFVPNYSRNVPGGGTAEAADPAATLFQNHLWCQHWKALKVKNRTLMPYRTIKESIRLFRKKPVWVYRYGNAGQACNVTNPSNPDYTLRAAVAKWGGATTVIKTVEFLGEMINDATAYPDTEFGYAPGFISMNSTFSFEVALPGPVPLNYVVGDGDRTDLDEGLTGQPWNYMFPSPSATSSLGTSVVVGALTSGV